MNVSESLARTTVRLECSNGTQSSVGTSFLYRIDDEDESWIPILITNRHVVANFSSARLTLSAAADLTQASPRDATTITVNELQSFVVYHPNPQVDLAAILLGPITHHHHERGGAPIHLNAINISDLVDSATESRMRFVENVIVVGYPQGLWDDYRNLPLFRQGITASPAALDYCNESKFLIDCSIYPGSSGSPVFLYDSGAFIDASTNEVSFGERVKLLGIVFAVMLYEANGQIAQQQVPTAMTANLTASIPNNLGVVLKAREILPLAQAVLDYRAQMAATEALNRQT